MGGSKRRASPYVAVQDAVGLGFDSWRVSAPREGLPLFGKVGSRVDPLAWVMTGVGGDKPRHVRDKDGKHRYRGRVQWLHNELGLYA